MAKRPMIIGTRGSELALWQANWVLGALRRSHPGTRFMVKVIKTQGDVDQASPLSRMSGRGVFVRQIEEALSQGEIDLAVHSLKDLPTRLPEGLALGAVAEREDPRDALVSGWGKVLAELPGGSRVGTSSTRRAAQLLAYRPDLQIVDVRGNLPTRLGKADTLAYDGIVVAVAGLKRLGLLQRVAEYLSFQVMLPAPGQGALAVEIRQGDRLASSLAEVLNHPPTALATLAERSFLDELGGGCRVPVAAYGVIVDGQLWLRGLVASPDGRQIFRGELRGPAELAEQIGRDLSQRLLSQGFLNQ